MSRCSHFVVVALAVCLLPGLASSARGQDADVLDPPVVLEAKPGAAGFTVLVFKPLAGKPLPRCYDRVGAGDDPRDISDIPDECRGLSAPAPPTTGVRVILRDIFCSENPFIGVLGEIVGVCVDG